MPEYFDRYINLVEDVDVIAALEKYGVLYLEQEKENLEKLGDKIYAPGKWTIKDILQHLIRIQERAILMRSRGETMRRMLCGIWE